MTTAPTVPVTGASTVTSPGSRSRSRLPGERRPSRAQLELERLLDTLETRGLLDTTRRQVLQSSLCARVDALARDQRFWMTGMLVTLSVTLAVTTITVWTAQPAAVSSAASTVMLALAIFVMTIVERSRQRRASCTLLLMRLLRHACFLGGDAATPDVDGYRLRRGILALEVTASIAGRDLVRQLTGERPNDLLTDAASALDRWLRSLAERVAIAGPEQILYLRREVTDVAFELATSGIGRAAATASLLGEVEIGNSASHRRRIWRTGVRLLLAAVLLYVMRDLTSGFSAQLRWALDSALGGVIIAAAGWIAVGLDPQSLLTSRWRRWAMGSGED